MEIKKVLDKEIKENTVEINHLKKQVAQYSRKDLTNADLICELGAIVSTIENYATEINLLKSLKNKIFEHEK